MAVLLSDNHPFPLGAVGFNTFDHNVSVTPLTTPTGVSYAVLSYTPKFTPGFDYNQYFTYAGAPSGPVHFTVSFNASQAQMRNYFLANGAPDLSGQLTNPMPLSAAEIANARAALAEYSMFTNLVFTEVSGGADIMYVHDERFGVSGFARNAFDVNWSPGGAYQLNNIMGFAAIGSLNDPYMFIHELGHVLTLKHVGPIQTDSETPFLPSRFLDNKYSIMFYDMTHPEVIDPGERFTRHLQLFDVYALQQRFGANTSWKTGDDVYTAASFDGWRQVLWDAGGVDTLDFSDRTSNQVFDLRGGGFSTLGGFFNVSSPDNLSIAFGVVIENAIGGSGDDRMIGNDAANNLAGGGGRDTLIGGAGADTLNGGAGGDQLFGGSGGDHLAGGAQIDTLAGGDGDDLLEGELADDALFGGNGADTLNGGDGNDLMTGNAGNDQLFGGLGRDSIFGGNDNDTLDGGDSNDSMSGAQGDDVVSGGLGADIVVGGNGDDVVNGDDGNDVVGGTLGNDTVSGGNGADTVVGGNGFDSLMGDAGDDELYGGIGDDVLNGGLDNDLLAGAAGDDTLIGGDGNDTSFGGTGNDTFIFALGDDNDTIGAFEGGAGLGDAILLQGFGTAFDSFTEVMNAASEIGGNVVIDLGGGDTLTLLNRTIASLNADDFAFG